MTSEMVYTKDLVYNKKYPEVIVVKDVTVLEPFRVHLIFSDGIEKDVDLEPYLHGPVFERIRNDPDFFRKVFIDPVGETLTWPNKADIDPDTLYYGDEIPPWWIEYEEQQKKKKARQLRQRAARKGTKPQRKSTQARTSKKRAVKSAPTRKKVLAKSK